MALTYCKRKRSKGYKLNAKFEIKEWYVTWSVLLRNENRPTTKGETPSIKINIQNVCPQAIKVFNI